MRAVVLAAGEGTRLRPYTADRPKCLVPLAGRPLLMWQIDALRASGIEDITVVTGYRGDMVAAAGVTTLTNPDYDRTNMVASLMCARALLDGSDDVLVAYGDIVYEPRLVTAMLHPPTPVTIAVDTEWRRLWEVRMADPLADAETLRIDAHGLVTELGRVPASYADIEGQYLGLIALRADFAPRLVEYHDALDPAGPYEGRDRDGMFMTAMLQLLIDQGIAVGAVRVAAGWVEVDTTDDLAAYEAMWSTGALGALVNLGAH
jgi:choline kinase